LEKIFWLLKNKKELLQYINFLTRTTANKNTLTSFFKLALK